MNRQEIYEKIQKELYDRMIPFCDQLKSPFAHKKGIDKIWAMADNLKKNTDTFNQELTDSLNQLIHEHKLNFNDDKEKNEFLDFIKPTNVEIVQYFTKPI